MKNMHSQESGRSMVEMLGVLAIIGVLSVGGIAGYSQAMSKFKVTKAMDQVQTIITNIRTLYASQRTYTSLTAVQAQAMGILTEESINGSEGLNPFGGTIEFGTGTTVGNNRTFTVKYTGLTSEACVKMATADWGADQSSGLISINIGGTLEDGTNTAQAWTNTYNWANKTLPVDVATATDKCSVTGSVMWQYR